MLHEVGLSRSSKYKLVPKDFYCLRLVSVRTHKHTYAQDLVISIMATDIMAEQNKKFSWPVIANRWSACVFVATEDSITGTNTILWINKMD